MLYIGKSYEIDTEEIVKQALKQGKRTIVPVTSLSEKRIIPSEIKDFDKELEEGPFGIKQPKLEYMRPVPINDIDMIITPGVAFDEKGNRLGHGAGYYDAFLKDKKQPTQTVGLAFNFQIVETIPILPKDIPVQRIISA